MAKRDKKEPEEEEDFVPSDFDEEAFIHKELVSFRTTVILFIWGIIAAAVSLALYRVTGGGDSGWYLGLAVAAGLGYGLKALFPKLNIDIGHWGRREWIGTGFLFFFTWLAFFIIFVNPPFTDIAAPEVEVMVSPEVQFPGEPLSVHVFARDNDALRSVEMSVLDENGDQVDATFENVVRFHDRASFDGLDAGRYTVLVTATDKAGLVTEVRHEFFVGDNAVEVDLPADGVLDSDIDAVFVGVPQSVNVFRVTAEVDGGGTVHFTRSTDPDGFVARRTYQGWNAGEQNFSIMVEPVNRFHANEMVPATPLELGRYSIEVVPSAEGSRDTTPKNTVNPTTPPPMNIPGVEVVLVGAAIVAVAFVRRWRG